VGVKQPSLKQRLSILALALDDEHDRLGWGRSPRLYGIPPDLTWTLLDEGDPYTMLDVFRLLPGEDYVGLGLVCEGWAAPMDTRAARPSRHPRRERVRTVAVVARGGVSVTTLRRRGRAVELLGDGAGQLLARLVETAATLALPDPREPPSAA
jgi:hypothetical protein